MHQGMHALSYLSAKCTHALVYTVSVLQICKYMEICISTNFDMVNDSILDFQAYVVSNPALTEENSKPNERALSHLRLNVGQHDYTSDKIQIEVQNWRRRSTSVMDAVSLCDYNCFTGNCFCMCCKILGNCDSNAMKIDF